MNIYRIYQGRTRGYDTYDSAIVVAENKEEAKKIHPCPIFNGRELEWDALRSWCESQYVNVEFLGKLENDKYKNGDVIIASFNAG